MYFLRWIAGYPILIILLVVGLYTLYNKDNLTHWFEKNDAGVQTTELGHVGEQVASTVEKASPIAETKVDAEDKPGSWLDIFKGRKTETDVASLPVQEEQTVVTTEAATSAEVDTEKVEKEGKSGSWLDIFKGRKTETEVASLPAQEEQTIVTTEAASSPGVEIAKPEEDRLGEQMMEGVPPMPEMGKMPPMPDMNDIPPMPEFGEMPPLSEMGEMPPMPEFGDIPPMPEMKGFPPMEPFPEMPMEPALVSPADESVAMTAPPAMDESVEKAVPDVQATVEEGSMADAEIAKVEKEEKSGSWLDIFKKKAEPEEASPPVQQDAAITTTEIESTTEVELAADVETAKVEEEKSGSWLDIFKRNKEEPSSENSADASPEFQFQQNESLRLAREAFWQRDFDAAEAIYTNMTKAEPENAGLLGEYGNVLLEAGKMGQALDVYEQVAELLIAEGRTFELRPLLYFIGDQDPERAQKLSNKMQAQQDTNK